MEEETEYRPRGLGPPPPPDAPHPWALLPLLSQASKASLHPRLRPRGAGGCWTAPLAVNSSRKTQLFVYKLRLVTVLASDSGAAALEQRALWGEKSCVSCDCCPPRPLHPLGLPCCPLPAPPAQL